MAVELILELLGGGMSEQEILDEYPGLKHDDILACLTFASSVVQEYRSYPIPA